MARAIWRGASLTTEQAQRTIIAICRVDDHHGEIVEAESDPIPSVRPAAFIEVIFGADDCCNSN